MTGIFDTHAHYDDAAFDADREALLASLPECGVCGIINCGTTLKSSQATLELAERWSYVYAAVGIHPSELDSVTEDSCDRLRELYRHPRAVAVGEIGLDYHYDTFPRELQREWLERQLKLAVSCEAPVILHDREAHEDTLALLRQYRPAGVVHCFSGSVETAREVLALGLYIGLGGAVTFKNARKPLEVAAMVPADRLLLETDAPYMAPVPLRGKRCDSSMIAETARVIASVRGCTEEELLQQTRENAFRAFPKLRAAR